MNIVDTHSRLVKSRLRGMTKLLIPLSDEHIAVRVEILNGMHAGISTCVTSSEVTIGSTCDDDIMLLDDEVLGKSAVMKIEASIFGPLVTIHAGCAGVKLNSAAIEPGIPSDIETLPSDMDFNGIRLRLHPADDSQTTFRDRLYSAAIPALAMFGLIALGGQTYLASRPGPDITLQAVPDNSISQTHAAQSSAQLIKEIIADSSLSDQLEVVSLDTGAIAISGTLTEDKMNEWRALRADVDQTAQGLGVVNRVTQSTALSNMPAIAAVFTGTDPVVVLADGKRLKIGARITSDWIIHAISESAIEVERNGEIVFVTF